MDLKARLEQVNTNIEKATANLKNLEDQERQVAAQKVALLRGLDVLSGAQQMLEMLIKEQGPGPQADAVATAGEHHD